jgi:hypothetical protein
MGICGVVASELVSGVIDVSRHINLMDSMIVKCPSLRGDETFEEFSADG